MRQREGIAGLAFVCGPPEMTAAARAALRARRVPRGQLHFEDPARV